MLRRQKVWTSESYNSFHFLMRCFKSLLYQDLPASNLVWALGSTRMALSLLLKTMPVMDCHGSKNTRCLLFFVNEIKQPIFLEGLWWGRWWWAPAGEGLEKSTPLQCTVFPTPFLTHTWFFKVSIIVYTMFVCCFFPVNSVMYFCPCGYKQE